MLAANSSLETGVSSEKARGGGFPAPPLSSPARSSDGTKTLAASFNIELEWTNVPLSPGRCR
ncbi:hypothetical protein J6590_026971 [Homalodisca vitripennis]|nr:hypothetical protein J6590_026971 [Homalodisca vitripennis]